MRRGEKQALQDELIQQIGRLHHGDHCCLLYESPAEQLAATIPFFKEGLARGERCLYIADDRTVEEVSAGLFQCGIDVGAEGTVVAERVHLARLRPTC